MNILITGGNGQVGFELQRSLSLFGRIYAPERTVLDLADPHALQRWLEQHQPDLIVNAAAYTAVDQAECEPEQAHDLNARVPAQLARYAAAHGSWLIHYSSDYVYPGHGELRWQEQDPGAPLSVYGQSKYAGDQQVQALCPQHLIFRTSWVYSARGQNFMKTMLRLGIQRNSLQVVADQWGAPTPARLIAQVTALAVARLGQPQALAAGIYHLAARGHTHWHTFAQQIFKRAAAQGYPLQLNADQVQPISSADYQSARAPRPGNSRLDVSKLEQALHLTLPHWEQQLALTLAEYLGTQEY